jgi:flagellar protein FlaG
MGMEIPGITASSSPADTIIPATRQRAGHAGHAGQRTAPGPAKTSDAAEIQIALEQLEKTSYIFDRRFKFSVNREINRIVVKVIDAATDKVIKEIPPEEIQRLVARIRETIGLLVDEKI